MILFLFVVFFQSFISCPLGIQKLGFVMATYGASTTVFALIVARISKYTGRYILFTIAGVVNLGVLVTMYVWNPSSENIFLIFLVPVIWGVAEGIWQIQSNGEICFYMISKQFSHLRICLRAS
jgi:hypothetical protein